MDLIARVRNKEEEALRELMYIYGNDLKRTAFLLLKDRFLAEEVVQDTFITAFEKMDQLENQDKLKGWLMIITINGCKSRMRRWSWKNIFLTKKEETFPDLVETSPLPDELLDRSLRNGQLYEAILALSYVYREVISLYYFQELTIKQISDLILEKENTVKTRLARGRNQLRKMLQEGDEEIDGTVRTKES
ncbi:sigma-70 family RNA polymerase sigma factor [Evansella tamaricis]|uniref:Sigma-70 family RNA polymerase sigma factor n=1 Tax=Evansella tamaricis TaxID=2069301 RepID=A0ABS6JMV3_9BACI|nr:sigma-70 family RNA polymerase sigma factor [Evansella tamaricis]MBU9713648.1 sigma-70 family RNA polymerase sigma factor [Evansella tamaricis]